MTDALQLCVSRARRRKSCLICKNPGHAHGFLHICKLEQSLLCSKVSKNLSILKKDQERSFKARCLRYCLLCK